MNKKIKCEADLGRCPNTVTYEISAEFAPKYWKPLKVCKKHKEKYRDVCKLIKKK